MDERLAAITLSVVFAVTLPDVAPMVDVPADTDWTRPAASTVATDPLEDDQVTEEVMSLEFEKVPSALICWPRPFATLGAAGISAMEIRVAGLTFNVVVPETPPKVAVMVAEPTDTALDLPAVVTVATAVAEDVQVTTEVKSKDAPSEYVAVAVSC
jgi:hypothetical protein